LNRKQFLLDFGILWIAAMFLYTPAIASGIHEATKNGDAKTVKALLIENPALRRSLDKSKRTPFHWAALSGLTDMIRRQCNNTTSPPKP